MDTEMDLVGPFPEPMWVTPGVGFGESGLPAFEKLSENFENKHDVYLGTKRHQRSLTASTTPYSQ